MNKHLVSYWKHTRVVKIYTPAGIYEGKKDAWIMMTTQLYCNAVCSCYNECNESCLALRIATPYPFFSPHLHCPDNTMHTNNAVKLKWERCHVLPWDDDGVSNCDFFVLFWIVPSQKWGDIHHGIKFAPGADNFLCIARMCAVFTQNWYTEKLSQLSITSSWLPVWRRR